MKALKVSPHSSPLGAGAPVFEVESDGESWTRIKPGSHQLELSIDIAAGSGWRVTNAYVGVPSADFGGTSNQSDATLRLGGGEDVKSLKFVNIYSFQTDDAGLEGQAIIAACNAGNHPPTQEHTVSSDIDVGIKAFFQTRKNAEFQEGGDDQGRSQIAYARAPITIRCLAAPSHAETPPKPVSVDIRVAQKGNTCPKDAEVTAYIDYEKPMTGRFQVVHNGKPGETIERKAREVSFAGKTWYRIERLERYELDPGKHDFQIKVIGGGESPTRSLDVDCLQGDERLAEIRGRGQGHLPEEGGRRGDLPRQRPRRGSLSHQDARRPRGHAGHRSHRARRRQVFRAAHADADHGRFDQMMRLELVNDPSAGDQKPLKVECVDALSGELTLQSPGANSCKDEALVAIHTDGAGELPYELECGPGKSWQRTVTAMANKIGVDKVAFDVTNNDRVSCALRTRIGGKLKPLDGASMTLTCHKPIDTGADDLAPDTRPDPQKPGKPDKVVIDPPRDASEQEPEPKIACAGGAVKGGACVCERTMKPVKAGKNAWRCVKIAVIDPPRNKDSGNRSDARVKGNNKSVKIGKTKAGISNRSSSLMPR